MLPAVWLVVLLGSLVWFSRAAAAPPPPRPAEIPLDLRNNGGSVEVTEDQELVVTLESNPAAGYSWQVADLNPAMLRQVGRSESRRSLSILTAPGAAQNPLLGAPVVTTLRFRALGAGASALRLVYCRPWEKNAPPTRSFSLQANGVGSFLTAQQAPPPAPTPEPTSAPAAGIQAVAGLPAHFNWCDLGGCTPVRDQGNCGSCWAFGTVGALESAIKINDGQDKDLSEQYLVSCNTDGWSCGGGWFAHDYHYNKPSFLTAGARYEADFPYQAAGPPAVPCQPAPANEKLTGWSYVTTASEVPQPDAIKRAIYEHGPVAAAMCAGNAFGGYTSGVFQTEESQACNGGVNHAIVLVGWDDTMGAWRLRNSWGSAWGDGGYMWIKWGVSNVGFAANYVSYPGSVAQCQPREAISCAGQVNGSNDQTGSTQVTDHYAGQTARDESGPEYTYTFTPGTSVQATFNLSATADLDLFVLDGASGQCRAGTSIAYGDTSAVLSAQVGHTYYVVVDGFQGATGNYTLDTQCAASAPPAAPKGLVASSVSASQIDLAWQASIGDISDYHIERSPDGTTGWTQIATVGPNETGYSDTGLACQTGFSYRVLAHRHSDDQYSAASNVAPATTQACPVQGVCQANWQLTCGGSDSWNNGGGGSTNQISHYACNSAWDESGPEYSYTFVPNVTGQATVNLAGLAAGQNLDLFVMQDAAGECSAGNCLASGDASATFDVQAGQTYYLVVDGRQGDVSNFTISTQCTSGQPAPVPNDDIRSAQEITSQPFADSRDMRAATSAPDDPLLPCISGQGSHSAWYGYVPSSDGTLTANTFGSDYDTLLAVWSGQPGALQNAACNDNSGGGLQSSVQVGVTAGKSYYIEVAGPTADAAGSLSLTFNGPPPGGEPARQRIFVPIVIHGN